MNELIPLQDSPLGRAVNARDLYDFLESKQKFIDWIKNRIEKYSFTEGEDFFTILGKSSGGRPSVEYALSLDCAKEISMVENNEKGKQARKYFIEIEKQAKKPLSQIDILIQSAQMIKEQQEKLSEIDQRVKLLETRKESDFVSIVGYCNNRGIKITKGQSQSYGKKATKLSLELQKPFFTAPDERWGKINVYLPEILDIIFSE